MKALLYFNYTARSLQRGGQRTILAVFCVAIGVMAVVSLQLVGLMLQHSLTANIRETNGGDIALTSPGIPLKPSDLVLFDHLKQVGTIHAYTTVIGATGGLHRLTTSTQSFNVEAVDPKDYPLVATPTLSTPSNGTVAGLLVHDQVIVTQQFLDRYHKHMGDSFNLYAQSNTGTGQVLPVRIAGVVANEGLFAQSGSLLLISQQTYLAANPTALTAYSAVDVITADQAHADVAVKAIKGQFPLAETLTVADLLRNQQSSINLVNTFLEIAGLIALLIGGVGIVNTMQVLLSRRKTEIAMLKTAGYRRQDLYMLFGLEAGLLGLIGGIMGAAAATGVSAIVRSLMANLGFNIVFALNFQVILTGVAIGFTTALIFGLLPIVQAANVRPLQVIRAVESKSKGGKALTILLLLVLSLLFCLLATLILNGNLLLGIEVTYGACAALTVLGTLFNLLVIAVSKLPVPERLQFKHSVPTLVGVIISLLVYQVMPVAGIFLLVATLLHAIVLVLPSGWKVSLKLALRNLGRQRGRTVTTLLALFIGVFGIGQIIGLGHDVVVQTNNTLNQNAPYNLIATASGRESSALHAKLASIQGLSSSREDPFVTAIPKSINQRSVQQVLGNNLQSEINVLGGIEGYNLAQDVPAVTISAGRNLNASDANTNNVLVSAIMTNSGWFPMGITPGTTITMTSVNGQTIRTVTVVGIISISTTYDNLGKVLAPTSVVNALSAGSSTSTDVFYMKVPSTQLNHALDTLTQIAPNAIVQDLTGPATAFLQVFGNILNMLVVIASLSVLAGLIVIANAVALAMLERKRELGILKAVGYTSSTVMREILLENGLVGGLGAFVAMFLASISIAVSTKIFFQASFSIEPLVAVLLVVGPVILAMLTAALVAWQTVRIRPLAVLRYE